MKSGTIDGKAYSINEDRDCVVWEAIRNVTKRKKEKKKKEKFLNAAIYGQCTLSFCESSRSHSDGECFTAYLLDAR